MNADTVKLGNTRYISLEDLERATNRHQASSEFFRQAEAGLIAEMARQAHLDRRRFSGWPKFEIVAEDKAGGGRLLRLHATVEAVLS